MDRPNLLLITTDQQSANMMSCTGNGNLLTPALDGLAANGIRFERAYSTQPLCIPQRCSMYTGMMPHETGVTFNVPDEQPKDWLLMGRIFAEGGYDTGYAGKWHINFNSEDRASHGFHWMDNIRSNGADLGMAACLQGFLERPRPKPFLFVASFNNPHNICEATRDMPLPDGDVGTPPLPDERPALPENFGIPANEPSAVRAIQERYREKNYPTANWDEARWRQHRWQYARMCEIVDRHIGDLLNVLRQAGHADDTVIIFTSDHGDGNGAHHWNQKQVLYDESARIPFIISGSHVAASGVCDSEHLVSMGLDLIPTLCNYAGIQTPDHLKGVSLKPLADTEPVKTWRDYIIIQTEFGTYGYPSGVTGRCVRTGRYKYMVYSAGSPREQLIDMNADPGEMTNLAPDPAHAAALTRHRALLSEWIAVNGDFFTPVT